MDDAFISKSSDVTQYWAQHEYRQAEHWYQHAIEADPAVRSHYWWLGLAMVLQGKEEDAQVVWMTPFMEADEEQAEVYTLELLEILDQEASRQAEDAPDRSWLIRQHIREIAPHQVNNLLLLVLLAVMLDRFDSSDLEDWSIIEQLSQTVEPVSSAIATTTVDQLLNTVTIDDRVVQF
ncbi:MAG: hypothetical protein AAFQ57_02410, partial [Cyanobacteria bacterium J06626_14]